MGCTQDHAALMAHVQSGSGVRRPGGRSGAGPVGGRRRRIGRTARLNQLGEVEDDLRLAREQNRIESAVSVGAVRLSLSLDDPLARLPVRGIEDFQRPFDRADPGPVPRAIGLDRWNPRDEQKRQQHLQQADKGAGRDHGFGLPRVAGATASR
jgi:hypothetical protein